MDMQDWLVKLDEKLDALRDSCAAIDKTQASMAKDLAYHIHRTDLLEERVDTEAAKVKPLLEVHQVVKFLLKLLGVASLVLGVWLTWTRIGG